MIHPDKNESAENENRNENQPLRETNNQLPDNNETDLPDLDGDGMIGNTGGFYGGTSYIGSNYGPDWNAANNNEGNEGNFGAAGQKDDNKDGSSLKSDEK